MSSLTINDTLALPNSSVRIPRLGFGVYQSSPSVCVQSCLSALQAGYRHIDTAQFYANESQVGEAVRKSGLRRSDIFVTTKILSAGGSVEKSYQKCVDSVNRIDEGTGDNKGYVDLFLIHSPNAGGKARKEMWQALEKLYEEGQAKSIGVSNFGVGHIEEMKSYAKVWPPHVNQIEVRLILPVQRHLMGRSRCERTDECHSYTHGANNGLQWNTATSTESSSKRTHLLCGTTRPTTQSWSGWLRNTTRLPLRY